MERKSVREEISLRDAKHLSNGVGAKPVPYARFKSPPLSD
jgi:hypothetical protein